VKNSNDSYSIRSYVTGFGLSLIITLAAYYLAQHKVISGNSLLLWIGILAFIQFVVQAYFFLHLGHEAKPRWKQIVFGFMVMVVAIIVFGSIWIMNNLNYHHLDPTKASDTYIIRDEGLKP
jgi:cytochrome o ubiquinol oxidase operon protein cyoD